MKRMKMILMMVGAALTFTACSKENLPEPQAAESAIESPDIFLREPAAGTYTIEKYFSDGIDQTNEFSGYTFEFLATGGIIITTPTGNEIIGGWAMTYSETTLSIFVEGTPALDDISQGDWAVERITANGMKLSANAEGLIFRKDGGY